MRSVFSLAAVSKETLQLCMWNYVRRQTTNVPTHSTPNIVSMSTTTNMANMATARISDDKSKVIPVL